MAARRVRGGANNALYCVAVDGGRYACKLCVADGRRRAAREFGAMRLLRAAGLDVAPQPVLLDESCDLVPYPAVVYRWLPGLPLDASLSAQQLAALLANYHRFHALRPSDFQDSILHDAWFHWFDFEPYLAEMRDFLTQYGPWLVSAVAGGRWLRDRLARLVDSCSRAVTTTAASPTREVVSLRLCRVDPNLANAVWDQDRQLRWVDWEYSGWGDPALDLAELRWHAALAGLGKDRHDWLRDHYRRPVDDPGFEERLATWDRILATRWPFLILRWLWSEHNGPDRVRLTQPAADRAELRARLVSFVERAERLAGHGREGDVESRT